MILSLSNTGATASLQAMAAARDAVSASQMRVSTGRKLSSARDDGAGFVIATHIQTAIGEQSVRQQSQLRAKSLLDITQSAVSSITDILVEMKEQALAMTDTSLATAERQSLSNDIDAMTRQIDQVAQNSSFNGINLLHANDIPPTTWGAPVAGYIASGSSTTTYNAGKSSGRMDVALDLAKATSNNVSIDWGDGTTYTANDSYGTPYTGSTVISHIYDDSNSDHVMTYNISAASSGPAPNGFHIPWIGFTPDPEKTRVAVYSDGSTLNITHKPMSAAALSLSGLNSLTAPQALAAIDNALTTSEGYAAYYGSKQAAVDRTLKLSEVMTDSFRKSYADAVDADMGKESALWQASQARLALATQSAAIASQAPKLLLSLFR